MNNEVTWIDAEDDLNESSEDIGFTEYDISASPNDFNIKTLFDFIGSGVVKIPGFQRNYVWDIKRASKLVESIIIGIPIPQIFLYEEAKNKFTVIYGQQRYMTRVQLDFDVKFQVRHIGQFWVFLNKRLKTPTESLN